MGFEGPTAGRDLAPSGGDRSDWLFLREALGGSIEALCCRFVARQGLAHLAPTQLWPPRKDGAGRFVTISRHLVRRQPEAPPQLEVMALDRDFAGRHRRPQLMAKTSDHMRMLDAPGIGRARGRSWRPEVFPIGIAPVLRYAAVLPRRVAMEMAELDRWTARPGDPAGLGCTREGAGNRGTNGGLAGTPGRAGWAGMGTSGRASLPPARPQTRLHRVNWAGPRLKIGRPSRPGFPRDRASLETPTIRF